MEPSLYEWQLSQNRCIEKTMVADIYINCYGSEDEFFANHLAHLMQQYQCDTVCNNTQCPIKNKSYKNSYLSFKYVLAVNLALKMFFQFI